MIELGLQRISRLLAKTPLPWRAVHVAGTNGKGSICAYVSGMLDVYNTSKWRTCKDQSILKHGRYTSPHLIDRWDCITINQRTVSFSVFKEVEEQVFERNDKERIGASEFELLTATAFEIFTREKVGVAVVEVGMGGRLDATNVIGQTDDIEMSQGSSITDFRPPPLVTAISSIGLDHQAFLGSTLEQITQEKAGIIKPGALVVYDDSNDPKVKDTIRAVATAKRSPIIETDPLLDTPFLKDAPHHVRQNANVAFNTTWTALQSLGLVPVDPTNISRQQGRDALNLEALAKDMLRPVGTALYPGRQQLVSIQHLTERKGDILLDGAHNAQSAHALASGIQRLGLRKSEGSNVTWVLAASDSKDAKEILAPLLRDGDTVFAVEFAPVDGMPWVKALPASTLLDAAKAVVPQPESLSVHDCRTNVLSALRAGSQKADGGPMVVAGSLYLVGDVLRLIRSG